MINKERVWLLIGFFVGSIIGCLIIMFTSPSVWLILVVILSIIYIIDWDKLDKKNDVS